jgi:hypothetical protein
VGRRRDSTRRGAEVLDGGGDADSCPLGVWRRVLALVLGAMDLGWEMEGRWGWIEYEYGRSGSTESRPTRA